MTSETDQQLIDPFIRSVIRRKVGQLIGLAGFTPQDRGDLERELLLRVVECLRSYDPTKGHRYKLVTAVVDRYATNLLRHKQAVKRDDRSVGSLNVTVLVADEGPVELSQTITQRDLDKRLGIEQPSDQDLAQLRLDVASTIAGLSTELADIAERLKTQTLAEIARETGMPRTTLTRKVDELRAQLERKGFDKFF